MGKFTEAEIVEVWERRGAGEPTRVIARRLGRNSSSIRRVFENAGGVRPAPRCRAERHLCLTEREEISRGVAAGESLRVIASRLVRAPSTVSREVTRNGGRHRYRAYRAHQAALVRARRPKECKLTQNPQLRQIVEEKLAYGLFLRPHGQLAKGPQLRDLRLIGSIGNTTRPKPVTK